MDSKIDRCTGLALTVIECRPTVVVEVNYVPACAY